MISEILNKPKLSNSEVALKTAAAIKEISTGTLSDVLDAMGIWGVMSSKIKNLSSAQCKFFGQAYTVHWGYTRKGANIKATQPSTWEQVGDFLVPEISDATGKIYVAGSDQLLIEDMALAGGLSTTYFRQLGFKALVLGGAIRDAHVVMNTSIPVMATGFTPADTQGCYQVMQTGGTTCIDGITVNTGDWVFGDASGVVVIPQEIVEDVISNALAIEAQEKKMADALKQGVPLTEIIRNGGRC